MKSNSPMNHSNLDKRFLIHRFDGTGKRSFRAVVAAEQAYGKQGINIEGLNARTGTKTGAKGTFEIALFVFFLLLPVWFGCASMSSTVEPPSRPWRCDRAADAAVEAGQWERALAMHDAFLATDPDNCLALYHRGYIHGILGHHAEEIRDYTRSIDCGNRGDDQLYFNLGMAYVGRGRPVDAAEAFTRAVVLDPDNPENHFGLAIARLELDNTDDAIAALHRVLALDPNHVDGRMALVRALLDAGKLDETRVHLQVLRQLRPDDASVSALQRQYEQRRATAYD